MVLLKTVGRQQVKTFQR